MSRYDDDYDVMGGAENENDAILLPLRKPRLPRAEEMIIKYNMLRVVKSSSLAQPFKIQLSFKTSNITN